MNFLEGQEEGKEFLTEITEKAHRGHREVTELFSAHSVFQCSIMPMDKRLRELCVNRS